MFLLYVDSICLLFSQFGKNTKRHVNLLKHESQNKNNEIFAKKSQSIYGGSRNTHQ